ITDDGFADIELAIESIERLVDSIDDSKRGVKEVFACSSTYRSSTSSKKMIELQLGISSRCLLIRHISLGHTCFLSFGSICFFLTFFISRFGILQELELLSSSDYADKEKQMKDLNKLYNDHIDIGTTKFALYYKQWLKVGAQAPAVPSVPLPSKVGYSTSRRRSMDSLTSNSSVKNNSLYRAVFGPLRREMMDDARNGIWEYEREGEEKISANGDDNSLSECEQAIRLVAKSWLDSHGDPETVKTLSTVPVDRRNNECFVCTEDDEILEIAI
ncbi:hypothetical protein HAX54_042208, partial [Datura stramonium]|nr:hypothetical protein [Datura stramonium]